jgi:hypothetical protein
MKYFIPIIDFVLDTSEQIESNNEDENAADNDVSSSLADMPSSSTDSPRLGNLGGWEKHTKVRNMNRDIIRYSSFYRALVLNYWQKWVIKLVKVLDDEIKD